MTRTRILVDANSYLRLAKTIRPLLGRPFGDRNYCLYILPEAIPELEALSLRKAERFAWVMEDEYRDNRRHIFRTGKRQERAIAVIRQHVADYVASSRPGPSLVDITHIAYALKLGLPVVTDDQDMTKVARRFGAEAMPTLGLLKLMLDCRFIDMPTIRRACGYLEYIRDFPANFHADHRRLFGRRYRSADK